MPINKNYTMKALNKRAKISIYGDVGMISGDIKKDLNSFGDVNEIHYQINSYGGYVSEGFTIADDLTNTGAKLISEGMGVAASIAAYLLIIPDKNKGGEVWAHENSLIMFHNPSGCAWGEAKLLKAEADALEKIEDILINTIMKRIKGLTKEEVRQKVADTWYLTANEAKALGLVDKVLEKIEVEEPKTDLKIIIPENIKGIAFTNKINAEPKPANKGVNMHKCKLCGKEIAEGQEMCFECACKKEREEAKAAEKTRIQNINTICRASKLSDEFINKLVDSGKTVDQCTVEIAEEIKSAADGGNGKGTFLPPKNTDPKVNKDEADKFRAHATNCLSVVCGLEKDPQKIAEARKDQPVNGLHSLMRRSLALKGIDTLWMDADELYRKAFTNMSTSDIPAILADVQNKSLEAGYNSHGPTFQAWCGTKNVKDFKEVKTIKMSDFSDMDDMPEGSRFKFGKFTDKQEKAFISTKGKASVISREMWINDDLDSISRIPYLMSASMARRLNRDVYGVLTANALAGPAMEEVSNMFLANNGNLVSGGDIGVPSVATIAATENLLLTQKSPKPSKDAPDVFLNTPARYLITGTNNRTAILQLLMTPYDISSNIAGVYNPYAKNIVPIFDPYLQSLLTAANKADGWYLAADPNVLESIGVAYLNGYTTPTIRSDASRADEALGLIYTIYFDYGVYASDFRGIAFNSKA